MKVRIICGFDGYKPGMVFDFPDGFANLLKSRRLVEEVVEEATVEERSEKAAVVVQSRKRRQQ
jgi:hypothetical protein